MTGESKKWLKFRIFTLLVLFLVLFVALISRAFQIQVLSGESLKSLAERQHIKTLHVEPERGIICKRPRGFCLCRSFKNRQSQRGCR
jgi:cell division protein FtsI (penicillin-binding protein 3)